MSLSDTIYVPIYLLTIVITCFIGLFVWISFQGAMTTVVAPTIYNTTVINSMNEIRVGLNSFDYMFPVLVIGLMILSLIFAYKTGASILYAFLSIIMWAFALLISVIISNIFEAFNTATFGEVSTQFTIMVWLMQNMKWFVLAWLFLISVVMMSRTRREEATMSASEAAFMT